MSRCFPSLMAAAISSCAHEQLNVVLMRWYIILGDVVVIVRGVFTVANESVTFGGKQ